MAVLKIEAFSGVSGDMFLGALAELTNAYDELIDLPKKLNLENVEVRISDMNKTGIACKHVKIIDNNEYKSANPLKPKSGASFSGLSGNVSLTIGSSSSQSHHHRHLPDIYKIIDNAAIPNSAKKIAKDIFLIVGKAEAKVHGIPLETIHFHEVGAIDSILDIVGTAFLLDKLKISKTYSTAVRTGCGFQMTEHGKLPVPCPATKNILHGIPTYQGEVKGEMATPTGAAILKFLNPEFEIPVLTELNTAHGPGEKNFEHPNVLRITLCEDQPVPKEKVTVIETNIDDAPGELLGLDFQDGLLEAGALDFFISQGFMKKGRPGILLSVLCKPEKHTQVESYILENTSTIGVRSYFTERKICDRETIEFESSWGIISLKLVTLPSGREQVKPEYEDCKKVAAALDISIDMVRQKVLKEYFEFQN
ncbi:nickel pincer cofactor biosynthesis protein LarC [Flexithrix dorotheae]|uniref:nickel pincer cofactor biosynthesis protein LarC n=1 Tax=Flexithrix dorotheae TaxID=70993 RepID=UPI00037B1D74|nr:nickel pincer cofactor biosynthesis protein LarC [Flexithrix dorotheae]